MKTENVPAIGGTEERILEGMLAIEDKYWPDTRCLVRFVRDSGVNIFSREGLEKYRSWLLEAEQLDPHTGRRYRYAPRTVNRLLAGAKKRIRQVVESDPGATALQSFTVEKTLTEIKGVKVAGGLSNRKLLTEEEVQILIDGCPNWVSLLVRFMASTGTRIGETVGIHVGDVHQVGEVCDIALVGKGNKARTVHVQRALVEEIRTHFRGSSYLFEHSGKPYSKIYCSQRIGVWAKRLLGRDHVSAHCLRHAFATAYLTHQPAELPELSAYLGHASTSTTTAFYIHKSMTPAHAVGVVQFRAKAEAPLEPVAAAV